MTTRNESESGPIGRTESSKDKDIDTDRRYSCSRTNHSTTTSRIRGRNNLSSWKTAVFQSLGASFTANHDDDDNNNNEDNVKTRNSNSSSSSLFFVLGNDQYWIKRQPSQHRRRQRQERKRKEEVAGRSSSSNQWQNHRQTSQIHNQKKEQKWNESCSLPSANLGRNTSIRESTTKNNQKEKKKQYSRRSWIPIFRRQNGDNASKDLFSSKTDATTATSDLGRPNDSPLSRTSKTLFDFEDDALESPLLAAADDDDGSEYVPRLYPDIDELLSLASPRKTRARKPTTITVTKEENEKTTNLKQHTDACTQTSFSISSEQKRQWEDNLAMRINNAPPSAPTAASSAVPETKIIVSRQTPTHTRSLVVNCPHSDFQTPHRRTPSLSVEPTSRLTSSRSRDNSNTYSHNKKLSLPSNLPMEDWSKGDNDDNDDDCNNTTRQHKRSVTDCNNSRRQKSPTKKSGDDCKRFHHRQCHQISITTDKKQRHSSSVSVSSPSDKRKTNHRNQTILSGRTTHSDYGDKARECKDDKIRELYLSQIRKGRRSRSHSHSNTSTDHNVHHERKHEEHTRHNDRSKHGGDDDGTVCSLKRRQSRIHSKLEKKKSTRRDFVMSWQQQPKSNIATACDGPAISDHVPCTNNFYPEAENKIPSTPSTTRSNERRGKRPRPIIQTNRTSELIRHFDRS